ncbi:MAG TPA: GntR family transcriptional regulator [Acidimicrobiales bacterium]|nr:GntR family transcriptional regulator [Acidimicrobiales bacterium]
MGLVGRDHVPLRQAVTDEIRDRIVRGEYPPGTRLAEELLARELEVSRNPVRESLQALAAEGFVELEPRRGARVARVDSQRATELFEVRQALEGLTAELAARKRTPEGVATLLAVVDEGRAAADRRELDELPMLNTRFHGQLATMADNQLLADTLAQLSGVIRWIYAERLTERVERSWHEHVDLAEAVARGDAAAARRLAEAHVASARDAYFAWAG